MSVEAVLMDLDGTLVDTAPDLVGVLNALLVDRGLPPVPFAIARNEVSNGAPGLLRLGFPEYGSDEALEPLRLEFLEIYTRNVCVYSRLFNGLSYILSKLNEISIPWGIVTNKPHSMTTPLLEALNLPHPPGCVISGDRLPQRKPHPAPLLLGADELGIDAEHCVYVGDARRDIDAGQAAGMATVAAAYGYIRAADDPAQWGASTVIRRPGELLDAVNGLA
ncbi:MAG: HAD-IA family hydrolase [Rhodospirillaceae bacterium]|nr:HAD-IA family hydrolase [Rhodospirillaceae bacterium]MDE0363660.1 HAD-IA family hydrolase [Rhodospirillaceae bacterium]